MSKNSKVTPTTKAERRIATAKKNNSHYLDLSGLGLTELPASLFELSNLESLDLTNNMLSELPEQLEEMKSLKWLELKKNPLLYAVYNVGGAFRTIYFRKENGSVVAQLGIVKGEKDELISFVCCTMSGERHSEYIDAINKAYDLYLQRTSPNQQN